MAQEVKTQARDLVGEARGQVQDQARTGQQKAAEGIRALSQELREMADGGQQSGTVSEIARQAADRADRPGRLAGRAGARRPRRGGPVLRPPPPGAFLLGAAVAGVVVGRLTRGAVDSARGRLRRAPRSGPTARRPTPTASPGTPADARVRRPAALRRPGRARVPRRRRRSTTSDTPTRRGHAVRALPRHRSRTAAHGAPHGPTVRRPRPARPAAPAPSASTSTSSARAGERGATPRRRALDDPYRPGGGDFR